MKFSLPKIITVRRGPSANQIESIRQQEREIIRREFEAARIKPKRRRGLAFGTVAVAMAVSAYLGHELWPKIETVPARVTYEPVQPSSASSGNGFMAAPQIDEPGCADTECNDGTFSCSTGRGTCAHHGGAKPTKRKHPKKGRRYLVGGTGSSHEGGHYVQR